MDLEAVIRRRRMCRDFSDRPLDPGQLDRLVDAARRAPSAGHTQGWAFVALEGPTATREFWEADASPSWLAAPDHPGLLRAPVILLPLANRQAYVERYSGLDKAASGGPATWDVPYWLTDTAFATMLLLLAAEDAGLGALLFALHADPAPLLGRLGVPTGWQPLGAVAVGWPAGARTPSSSAGRGRKPVTEVLHRGRW